MIRPLLRPLASLVLLAGVASAADATDAEQLAASAAKWQKAKEECGGNYSYKVTDVRFTGYRAETVVVVKDNQVVERRFKVLDPGRTPNPPTAVEWSETGKELGTHKENGVELRTLDALYEIAKKISTEAVPEHHVRSLGFDDKGLLRYCFLRDKRIMDDAPLTGVKSIQLTLGSK